MITPNPDYRANPDRAVYVHGKIDQHLIEKLTPLILQLQNQSRAPISVFIDSQGGSIASAEILSGLLRSSDQNFNVGCRLITTVTSLAASAAADLLCSGDYAIAYPDSTIFFHGGRSLSDNPITVSVASKLMASLRVTNERYAMALADKSLWRLGFRYINARNEFGDYRIKVGEAGLSDLGCFIGITSERLSSRALRVVGRARKRNERYEALIARVSRIVQRNKRFTSPKRPADPESAIIKGIVDFELSQNKELDWTFSDGGLSQLSDDFLLVKEYLDIYDSDHLKRLCNSFGFFFLSEDDQRELAAVVSDDDRKALRATKLEALKPTLRPLWLFFVALCYALQEDENELTASDAFWLGLIDEVLGVAGLFPSRLMMEHTPDPDPPAPA